MPCAAAGPCCCVATLDLEVVLQLLEERAERETELRSFIEERLERIKALESRVEQLRADLDILPPNGPEWLDKREEVLRAEVELRNEQNFLNLRGSELEASMKRDLLASGSSGRSRRSASTHSGSRLTGSKSGSGK